MYFNASSVSKQCLTQPLGSPDSTFYALERHQCCKSTLLENKHQSQHIRRTNLVTTYKTNHCWCILLVIVDRLQMTD